MTSQGAPAGSGEPGELLPAGVGDAVGDGELRDLVARAVAAPIALARRQAEAILAEAEKAHAAAQADLARRSFIAALDDADRRYSQAFVGLSQLLVEHVEHVEPTAGDQPEPPAATAAPTSAAPTSAAPILAAPVPADPVPADSAAEPAPFEGTVDLTESSSPVDTVGPGAPGGVATAGTQAEPRGATALEQRLEPEAAGGRNGAAPTGTVGAFPVDGSGVVRTVYGAPRHAVPATHVRPQAGERGPASVLAAPSGVVAPQYRWLFELASVVLIVVAVLVLAGLVA